MTDMERVALKEEFITYSSHRKGHTMPCRASGEALGGGGHQMAEGVRGEQGQSLYCSFCGKEWARQGRHV